MKEKRTFYVRQKLPYKEQVDYIYEYFSITGRNGSQRFIFHKQLREPGYAISDSHTGTCIMKGLHKMSKLNFNKICEFVLCTIDVRKNQERFPRVSKLKNYKGE